MKYCPICATSHSDHVRVCDIDGAILVAGGKKDPFLGRIICSRYKVINKIGEGGMGSVYLAEQLSVGRNVALKFLLGNYSNDDAFIGRFHREARLVASLNHRHIVTVYDFDQAAEGSLFIAMEYVNGQKLRDIIADSGPMDIRRATHLGAQIAEGFECAHRTGVIHRDIKPDNIMLVDTGSDEEIKLMDFGIARLRDDGNSSQLTQTGSLMGTPAYMAPEQAEGTEVSDRTDIYSLGIVLYEMLAGKVPFTAGTSAAVLVKQIKDIPVALRKVRPEVPVYIERLIMQALEKNPKRRPDGMTEVVRQLKAAEENLRGQPTPPRSRINPASWEVFNRRQKPPLSVGDKRTIQAMTPVKSPVLARLVEPERQKLTEEAKTVVEDGIEGNSQTQRLSSEETPLSKPRQIDPKLRHRALVATGIVLLLIIAGLYVKSPKPPEIRSLTVTASKTNLKQHEPVHFDVTAKYSNEKKELLTSGLEWRSSDNSIVNITPQGDGEAQKDGSVDITVQYGELKSQPIRLSVKTPAPPLRGVTVNSILIIVPKFELKPNEQLPLRLQGQFSNGKKDEISSGMTWKSNDESVAPVDSKGVVTARNPGGANITADYKDKTSPIARFTVRAPPLLPPVEPDLSRARALY